MGHNLLSTTTTWENLRVVHPSKNKGNVFERELVNLARDSGLRAKRAYASDGTSLGHTPEVDLLVAGFRIQAKRRKNLASFLVPSEEVDATAFRRDYGESLILMRYSDWLDLVKRSERNDPIQEARR